MQIFRYQAKSNAVYASYIEGIKCDIAKVDTVEKIPFLPITFFKNHTVITANQTAEKVFYSSGTTGSARSQHLVADLNLYQASFRLGFEHFFGQITTYTVLALLPSYLEQGNSSLVYMVDDLIRKSQNPASGFYLNNYKELLKKLLELDKKGEKVLLIGVSYALLDLIELAQFQLKNVLVMETGGMKGRRKELIKSALHQR